MRKLALLFAILFFFTPRLIVAQRISCDIVVTVFDESTGDSLEGIEAYCYSYAEDVGKTDSTDHHGDAYFDLRNWPNPGGCDENHGDYMLCLPFYWVQEDVYYGETGECSEANGCNVTFYIDPEDKHATRRCIKSQK